MKTAYNIALSGGGVRGCAHIGVLKALLEKGITINAISAASSGAIIGAFLCDGFHPDEIEQIVLRNEFKIAFSFRNLKESLLSFAPVANVMNRYLRSKTFDTLKIPLFVAVTNLNSGKQEIINTGRLTDAIIASSAIPVLFPPVIIGSVPYGDGGLSNNLPVSPFLGGKNKIIGVHVNPVSEFNAGNSFVTTIDRTMHLLMRANIISAVNSCTVFIEPPALKNYHLFQSGKTKEIIQVGYDYAINNEFLLK